MARMIPSLGRWLAVPIVVAHGLLSVAAVSHCHETAASAGSPLALRLHRHWVWHGHPHHDDHHAHGERPDDDCPAAPENHEGSAIYPADAWLVAVGPTGPALPMVSAEAVLPPMSAVVDTTDAGRPRLPMRPPGGRLPTLHDLLPHVLRV